MYSCDVSNKNCNTNDISGGYWSTVTPDKPFTGWMNTNNAKDYINTKINAQAKKIESVEIPIIINTPPTKISVIQNTDNYLSKPENW